MSYPSSMTMRLPWQAFAVAVTFLAASSITHAAERVAVPSPSITDNRPDELARPRLPLLHVSDESKHQEPVTIVLAVMSGNCTTLKIAGRDYRCRAIAFFQTEEGRANFVIALDDPSDNNHIITFSGDNGRRPQNDLYELPIDRMLIRTKDRPKMDGLPVPLVELSAGVCRQLGVFASRQVSSITCSAVDKNGQKYDLQYESDGSPIAVRRVKQTQAGRPAISPFD